MSASWGTQMTAGCCSSSPRSLMACLARSPAKCSWEPRPISWNTSSNVYKGKVWRYPLYRPLYPTEDERLTEFLMATIHTPYDKLGAIRSAGVGLSWIESLLHPDNLNSIFCSELVAAAYACVGLWATAHVARWNPNRLARWLRSAGVLRKPRRLK